MFNLARRVYSGTACDLPGVSMAIETFRPAMWAAVRSGHVPPHAAAMVDMGLRWGFEAGAQPARLKGQRVFTNYPSATGEFRGMVAHAIAKRVAAGRTLDLGVWTYEKLLALKAVFGNFFIFPMGAVPKALEADACRPTSDHTRTGFNAAVDMTHLSHSLTALADIASELQHGYCMHVSDVDAAFPMLPWAPWLWAYMFHRFYPLLPDGTLGKQLHLYVNINGDFGTRGLPGVFKTFLVDVVVQMARAAGVLTLPMPVYVDDMGAIGSVAKSTIKEMVAFQDWSVLTCGINFKRIKDRVAAQVQLMLGFWWDSFSGTRTLEERKLVQYTDMLLEYSSCSSLSLLERQQVAGRMQRAVLTMPPGAACLLGEMFALMVGLSLAWHRRRTTRAERANYRFFHDVLKLNLGKGYFSYVNFSQGEMVKSDASKKRSCTGGGWFTSTGRYDWYLYGNAAARRPIDFLEGDTVVGAVERLGSGWKKQWIPFGVDNQAFQKSADKGRSRAERLNLLLKRLFVLQIRFDCILRFFWLSTTANYLADHLSRDRAAAFLAEARASGELDADAVLVPEPDAGRTRTLDMTAPFNEADMAAIAAAANERVDMAVHSRHVGAAVVLQAAARSLLARQRATFRRACMHLSVTRIQAHVRGFMARREEHMDLEAILHVAHHGQPHPEFDEDSVMSVLGNAPAYFDERERRAGQRQAGRGAAGGLVRFAVLSTLLLGVTAAPRDSYSAQSASVSYPRATLFDGVPEQWRERLGALLDNRLAASSMRTVQSAVRLWEPVCDRHGWHYVIPTDCPQRGGMLVTYVLHLMEDTSLVGSSISSYVWGLRTWHKLQFQADPVLGVMDWRDFMTAVRVLTHVPHEPRRYIPMELIEAMAADVDLSSFWEVQFMFFVIVLLCTFSRSECPCPKHFTGPDSWDPMKHWCVRDIKIALVAGVYVLAVRFKKIKQDPRIERPAARGDGSDPGAAAEGGSDWSYVGDAPDSPLSPFLWYRRLMAFYDGPREPSSPFFTARDRVRPYTYSAASADLKSSLGRVSTDTDFGLHGLRVTGYNKSKEANGEDLAVAHGGWKPGSNSRYDRFSLRSVFAMAGRMLSGVRVAVDSDGEDELVADGAPVQPRELVRTRLTRHSEASPVARAAAAAASSAPGPDVESHHISFARLLRAGAAAAVVAEPAARSPPLNLRLRSTGPALDEGAGPGE